MPRFIRDIKNAFSSVSRRFGNFINYDLPMGLHNFFNTSLGNVMPDILRSVGQIAGSFVNSNLGNNILSLGGELGADLGMILRQVEQYAPQMANLADDLKTKFTPPPSQDFINKYNQNIHGIG